jgi:hypothetical protein
MAIAHLVKRLRGFRLIRLAVRAPDRLHRGPRGGC